MGRYVPGWSEIVHGQITVNIDKSLTTNRSARTIRWILPGYQRFVSKVKAGSLRKLRGEGVPCALAGSMNVALELLDLQSQLTINPSECKFTAREAATAFALRRAARSAGSSYEGSGSYLTTIIDFGRPKNFSQCSSASGKYRRISVAVSSCVDNTSSSVCGFGQPQVCPSGHHIAAL